MDKFYIKKNNKKRGFNTGFTLVETLIALFVFSLSVVVVMTVLGQGITSTNYARNKLIATYLAQEGIEYFRNMRDTSMLYYNPDNKMEGWGNFLKKLEGECEKGCYFSSDKLDVELTEMPIIMEIPITACLTKTCPNLWYYKGNYGYNTSGEKTVFSRKMSLKRFSEEEIIIFSEVFWLQGTQNHSIVFSENLSAWIK